jgi:hypothetical protein
VRLSAGQRRYRWSVQHRHCHALHEASSTSTSQCDSRTAKRAPSLTVVSVVACSEATLRSGQIHCLAHNPAPTALFAPSAITMDMDKWAVAVLGESSVGKSTLVQQVRRTLWVGSRILADSGLTRPS